MRDDSDGSRTERHEAAIARCRDAIEWYQRHKSIDRTWFFVTQSMAVAFGALAPVVIALDGWKWLQALLPALGAIAAGLGASFGFRENWARFGVAEELLKSEWVKFKARATPVYAVTVDDEAALSNFVERVEAIVMSEATQWKTDLQGEKTEAA